MSAQLPEITFPANRISWRRGWRVLCFKIDICIEQDIDFRYGEAGDFDIQIDLNLGEVGQFDTEEILVPGGIFCNFVISQDIGTFLSLTQMLNLNCGYIR